MNKLSKNFLWGNSVSSMQTEGAANEGGKGKSVYDTYEATAETSDWQVAIDEYHRYPEDIALMKDLGMNCYRFQISWSRVQPDGEGEFNEEGIKFYSDLVDQLLAAGIQPMVALYHFDMPLNLAKKYNGFVSKQVVEDFYQFGKKMVDVLGDRVKYWLTFNEQNLYGSQEAFKYSGYLEGDETLHDLYQISHNVMVAHAKVANYIHANKPDLKIGGMEAYREVYPATCNPQDVAAVREYQEFTNNNLISLFTQGKYSPEVVAFMESNGLADILDEDELAELSLVTSDFFSFSYYSTSTIDSTKIPMGTPPNYYEVYGGKRNPYLAANEWGWAIDPTGFETVLVNLANRLDIPIFPIENGIGVREHWDGVHPINDTYRIEYHRNHIQAVKNAVAKGANILGYLGWGLIDIPSSAGNMEKRYGVVYVNRSNHDLKDLKRVPKQSYYWLKKVISSNGEIL